MKVLAAFCVMLVLAVSVPLVAAQQPCVIERVTYREQGLQMVSWVMKPARDGRFPVVVWSHGAKFPTASVPIITEKNPCHSFVVNSGWMIFFVQTPGYGGSEGPGPEAAYFRNPMDFLYRRADSINAAVEWLTTRADVNPGCIVNMGWSQGGFATLLASAKKPQLYRAAIAHAPGTLFAFDGQTRGIEDLVRAGKSMPFPILLQSNTEDALVFVEGTRILARELRRWGRTVEYKEYTHSGGHQLFNLPDRPEWFPIWGADTTRFLGGAFAGCVP